MDNNNSSNRNNNNNYIKFTFPEGERCTACYKTAKEANNLHI